MWNESTVPSTAPIFDDAVYFSEALNLLRNQNEDDVDSDLVLLARESGIHDPYRFLCPAKDISRALSTVTLDSDHRSSMSIHSQETQSTSFTSAPSCTSRDHIYPIERSPAQRIPPKLARASLSAENYTQAMEGAMPGMQQGHSTSTLSIAPRAVSVPSSPPTLPPRRKRGSALFAIFRKDSRYYHQSLLPHITLMLCVAPALLGHTMAITPSLEATKLNVVTHYLRLRPVYTFRKH